MKDNVHVFYCTVRDFLCVYLPRQRGVSGNTIKSYREALNLLIKYLCGERGRDLIGISFQCISKDVVEGFLQWLENERDCAVSTRNQRLSALKTFLKYAGGRNKTLMPLYMETASIPKKKDTRIHEIEFFSETALATILNQPDRKKKNGQRDLFLLILMYDTGTRVQEMLDLKLGDVYPDGTSPHIIVTGKGSKTRLIPIMEKTCRHFESYRSRFHNQGQPEEYLFYIERKGVRSQMSVDNVEKFVSRYGEKARMESPEVPEHLKPHIWRHSRAMHLYRNGMPLTLVAEWLGHTNMETTRRFYANADTAMKKAAIDKATSGINPLSSKKIRY